MRTKSYALIEIPRLSKELLLCNQVGEATFVSEKMRGRDLYLRTTKEQLVELPGIHKVVFDDQDQWQGEIDAYLFPAGQAVGGKLDVSLIEQLRPRLALEYPPDVWVKWKARERTAIRPLGMSWRRVGIIFGLPDFNPKHQLDYLELAAKVHGEDNEVVKPALQKARDDAALLARLGRDPVLWATEVSKQISLEKWMKMTQDEWWEVHIAGWAIAAVGSVFDMPDDSRDNAWFLELARRIWGDQPALLAALEEAKAHLQTIHGRKAEAAPLGSEPAAWREEVKRTLSDEAWVNDLYPERKTKKFSGKGLWALAKVFGTPKNPQNNWLHFLELGAAIYGKDSPHIKGPLLEARSAKAREEALGQDPVVWAQRIRNALSADDWIQKMLENDGFITIEGKGLKALSTIFGFQGKSRKNYGRSLAIGRKVFGSAAIADALRKIDTTSMQYKTKAVIKRELEEMQ